MATPGKVIKIKHHHERLPAWAKSHVRNLAAPHAMKVRLRELGLHTVCEEAKCPNIGECFAKRTATVMIMGDRCTRNCSFCSVMHDTPLPLDPHEPENVARLTEELGLRHVVITSVARDDLPDEGAAHFAACVRAVKERTPDTIIEVLTPDFHGRDDLLRTVADAPIDVFNHNIETVERLQRRVRHEATYERSMGVLAWMARERPEVIVKSGLMVGLGETDDEIDKLLGDLRDHGVQALTIGQYLRPGARNQPVHRYVAPEAFDAYAASARRLGFRYVASGPLVRSSYMAENLVQTSAQVD
ncbi:MAG: lipoyl synthase [Deltaproteobacteria bacterium]|nr:lipoyl synthase [Deltaproteobacteria bacterium]